MSAPLFAVGDIVRLNSCADRMTVDALDPGNDAGEIVCVWFDNALDLRSANFHAAQLVKLPKPKGD
jgi:uncharacterized protein YodC (DUF2158 family)